jgi:hypothetical protein
MPLALALDRSIIITVIDGPKRIRLEEVLR